MSRGSGTAKLIVIALLVSACSGAPVLLDATSTPAPTDPTPAPQRDPGSPCGDGVWDAAEQGDPALCPQDNPALQGTFQPAPGQPGPDDRDPGIRLTIDSMPLDLGFTPDPGLRVDYAGLPNAGIDPSSGIVHLYYNNAREHPTMPNMPLHATSADGLTFSAGEQYATYPFDSRNTLLPDGNWRRYFYDEPTDGVKSQYSTDGIHFEAEAGLRYELQEQDAGWMGVNTVFSNPLGEVVYVYLGDKEGLNNTRLAVSTDGGETFQFVRADLLGDAIMGGGGESFVDPASLLLPDGRVRLMTMRLGRVYTFISTDQACTTFAFEGLQLSPEDFTEFKVQSFFDPKPVLLSDGRIRIYVTALIVQNDGMTREAIVSATSNATTE